jgi:uncharacterized protein YneF (UPF0154 family)
MRDLLLQLAVAAVLGLVAGVINGYLIANHVIGQLRDAGVIP